MDYRTQQQMHDVFGFGISLMFVGIMFGIVKSLVSSAFPTAEKRLPQLPKTYKKGTEAEIEAKYPGLEIQFWGEEGYRYNGEAIERSTGKYIVRVKGTTKQEVCKLLDKELAQQYKQELKPPLVPQVAIEVGEPVPSQYRYLSGWLREPLPEYSLAVEPEVKERKIDAVLKQLKEGVEGVQNSENFRQFLLTMSKFHDYSIGNLILIAIQKPDATRVAGFNTWKEFGRWVKKGEKGIAILAPVMPPRPTCPVCGAKIPRGARYCPQCGEPVEGEEAIEATPAYFKVVYVFDVSQTEGKELPEFEVPVLTGEANEELFSKVLALASSEGLTVSFEPKPYEDPSLKGQYFGKSIWVRPEESRAQQLKTLLHEVAHYFSEGVFHIPRRDAETIAESAAFAVGAHFGFDTGVRSFPYVALWAEDKKVLEENLTAIRKVTTTILEALGTQHGNAEAG